jgi:hypothetical protein
MSLSLNNVAVSSIYALCEPRTGEIRYIGKTSMPIQTRLHSHVRAARRASGRRYVSQWIQSLDAPPTIRLLLIVRRENDAQAECGMIALYRARGCRLTNLTDGGEGVYGYKQSAELKAKRSLWMKGNKHSVGRKLSEEHRQKIGDASRGRRMSEEVRLKMSAAQKGLGLGRKHTAEHRAKIRAAQKGVPWSDTHKGWKPTAQALENRAEGQKRVWAARTKEERTAYVKRIWEARRRNKRKLETTC